jgi:hypothetical protein
MQTWLYFGLLSATLGPMWTSGMQQSFLESGPKGERWLNTQCLQSIVADWAGYVAEVPDGLRWKAKLWMWQKQDARIASAWFRSIRGLSTIECRDEVHKKYEQFREAMTLIRSVMLFCQRLETEATPLDQVLALTALGSFLTTTWIRIYQHFYQKPPENLVSLDVGKAMTSTFFHSHMLKMNWCPSDICRIMGKGGFASLWYHANMRPPRADKDHSACPEEFCLRCQIDKTADYKLSHVKPGCQCGLISADLEDLRPVVDAGGIPVFSLDAENAKKDAQQTLNVQDSKSAPYVAISHVWAEGLGNKTDNALHSCQLVGRLFDLVRRLPVPEAHSRALWIDTICVPVYKRDGELHAKAMNMMKDTYRSAAEVLVLDAYLQSFQIKDASPLEAFSRVVNSSWMQRLWTLQEGRLAQTLYFQFQDGPVELGVIYSAIPMRSFPARPELTVATEVTMGYLASKFHLHKETQKIHDVLFEGLLAARNAVMFRALSEPSDEARCLATLLDLDPKRIGDAPEDKRMEALWESFPLVPVSLVFSQAPNKLSTPGFHWAPSTFCGPVAQNLHDWWAGPDHLWTKMEAVPTRLGLLVQLPGLFLEPVKTGGRGWSKTLDFGENDLFQLPDGRWIGVCLGNPWARLSDTISPRECNERMAILLEDGTFVEKVDQKFDKPEVIVNAMASRANPSGVIARITQLNHSIADSNRPVEIHVNGIQHVMAMELPPEVSLVFNTAVDAAHELWERLEPGLGLNKEVVKVCMTAVKEFMKDEKVMDACRKQRREAGAADTDEEIMYMLAEFAHNIYLGGYNSAEIVPDGCKWYVD